MPEPIEVIVYPHTHWDREWWATFQDFRFRLVATLDEVLRVLEDQPAFTTFTLDGQNIILEDYLAVRPHNRARVAALIKAGRLQVGPCYVLADHFLTSGESAIRNLWMGERVAGRLGVASSPVAYLPDQFGHPGQMPQILRGFGIDSAVVWRGFGGPLPPRHGGALDPAGRAPGSAPAPASELEGDFWWEAPDGSRVLAVFLAGSYDRGPYEDERADRLRRFVREARHGEAGVLLEPYGHDHARIDARLPALVAEIAGEVEPDGISYRIGSLAEYVALVLEAGGPEVTWYGEGRAFGWGAYMLPGVLSARLDLKRANRDAQVALERYAEPCQALAWMLGGAYEAEYLELAWRLLLENHPHDSICGCSIDQVHREMGPRFDQSQQVARLLGVRALETIAACIEAGPQGPDAQSIAVFNPLAWAVAEPCSVLLDPSLGVDAAGWRLTDPEDGEAPFQVRPVEALQPRMDRVAWTELTFPASVPGLGYTTYRLERRDAPPRDRLPYTVTGEVATAGDLWVGPGRMGNARLEISVDPAGGTLTVSDLETGLIYPGLNAFRDGGDAGDTYNYSWPLGDRTLGTELLPPVVEWLETGPARATVRLTWDWSVPAGLAPDRLSRASQEVPLRICSEVSLAAGLPRVDIRTRFFNRARNHRLRALFPLGAPVETSQAESVFEVVERPTAASPAARGSLEPAVPEHPQQSFVSCHASGRGLTIANRGLPEFSVAPDGTVALTLLRAVGDLSRDDLLTRAGGAGPALPAPDAQMLREVVAEYAIITHAGSWQAAGSHRAAHAFNAPLMAVPLLPQGGPPPPPQVTPGWRLPRTASLLLVSGDVVLSAVKRAESGDALVVRLLNEGDHPARVELRPWRRPARARLVDLHEEPLAEGILPVGEPGVVEFVVEPWRLVTVAFTF